VTAASEFTCQDLVELVTDYLEGALERSAEFDAHVAECPDCTEYLDQMRHSIEVTGSVGEADLSPVALGTLLEAFGDWKRERNGV
jgi:predicted anti-sigma-YlaC factor YlaD